MATDTRSAQTWRVSGTDMRPPKKLSQLYEKQTKQWFIVANKYLCPTIIFFKRIDPLTAQFQKLCQKVSNIGNFWDKNYVTLVPFEPKLRNIGTF